jgi:hypothetical protein
MLLKKIWADSCGPRLEHILRNAFLALRDQREAILADVLRLLDDRAFRRDVVVRVYSPRVRDFWLREYENYPVHFRAEAVAPIQNKVGAFLAHPILNRILCEGTSSFVLRRMMDQRKILLVNLAKGKIGEDAATLLGALLISSMGVAALSRAEIAESERKDFFVYLDEFQNFTKLSLANMLSELRKYRVGMILTHQYLNQIEPQVRESVLANAGTIISFRLGVSDAEILEKEMYPEFSMRDLVNLPNYSIYLKLMIEGVVSRPFSAETRLPAL